MMVFSAASLAYLAVPKTASTAIEGALRRRADMIFAGPRKHMNARMFDRRIAPFLAAQFDCRPDRIAVMRAPLDQLASWYRYRQRAALHGSARSTQGLSFDAFVRAVLRDPPPPFARIGSQHRFVTAGDGRILLHRLFAYAELAQLCAFFEARLQMPVQLGRCNVSPPAALELEPATERALRRARVADFALYDRLMDAGGAMAGDLG